MFVCSLHASATFILRGHELCNEKLKKIAYFVGWQVNKLWQLKRFRRDNASSAMALVYIVKETVEDRSQLNLSATKLKLICKKS